MDGSGERLAGRGARWFKPTSPLPNLMPGFHYRSVKLRRRSRRTAAQFRPWRCSVRDDGLRGDRTNDAKMWRHRDGSDLSAVELAQSRAACRKAAMRTDRYLAPFSSGNPAYHPGGIGLETTSPPGGFGYSSSLPNVPPAEFDDPERLEVCLDSKGIVRAP
jgi:hypothetical protein